MRIQHNISALNAHRQLGTNNTAVSKNLEKLSSGYRINRAADDAAGLAISEKMRGQIRGLNQAQSNAQDGISLIQTAEGGLNETHSILQRMRELSVQNSNGTYQDGEDRANANKEFNALQQEIDRIGNSTKFNKISLLTGSTGGAAVAGGAPKITDAKINAAAVTPTAVAATASSGKTGIITAAGSTAAQDITFKYKDDKGADKVLTISYTGTTNADTNADAIKAALESNADIKKLFDITLNTAGTSGDGLTIKSKATGSGAAIFTSVDTADKKVTAGTAATKGADAGTKVTMTTLKANDSITVNGKKYEFLADPKTATAGSIGVQFTTDLAGTLAAFNTELAKNGVKAEGTGDVTFTATKAGGDGAAAINFRIGANADAAESVSLNLQDMRAAALGVDGLAITSEDNASAAITAIDTAINTVSGFRADLGALQNRLEHTVANLGTTSENLTAAESRIRDVDMAKEMMEMTKNNILTQAAQSMLAQANTQPQGVLQLLR